MFLHMYKYKFKALIRQKEEFFWILIFPIILGTFFFLAFSKVSSATETFDTIDIAVVATSENNTENNIFYEMLEQLKTEKDIKFFNITHTTYEEAKQLLLDKKITGIIILEGGIPSLEIISNGINETIVKSVLDTYIQNMDILNKAIQSPKTLETLITKLSVSGQSVIEKELTKGNTDNMSDYYYALIAMACMFATLSGQDCATGLKANLSAVGMRKTLSSQSRIGMILGDAAASFSVHLISNAFLVAYLQYVLKLNLGGGFFQIYLVTVMGSLIAMSIGIMIGSIPKLSFGSKIGINIAFSLVSSFLSGLMVGGIKNAIEKHCPIINRLNPSSLISDALYSLNIYDDYRVYTGRLLIMLSMAVVLIIISYCLTRREKYDSI